MTDQLETAIRKIHKAAEGSVDVRVSSAAFRAAVEQRLAGLERDVGELRSRINGLIFVVIGAVLTQVVLRLVQ
jgi:hypothetical protein